MRYTLSGFAFLFMSVCMAVAYTAGCAPEERGPTPQEMSARAYELFKSIPGAIERKEYAKAKHIIDTLYGERLDDVLRQHIALYSFLSDDDRASFRAYHFLLEYGTRKTDALCDRTEESCAQHLKWILEKAIEHRKKIPAASGYFSDEWMENLKREVIAEYFREAEESVKKLEIQETLDTLREIRTTQKWLGSPKHINVDAEMRRISLMLKKAFEDLLRNTVS